MRTVNVLMHSAELRELVVIRMCADPLPRNVSPDVLDDFLNRASAELGYTDWIDAYHALA